MVTGFNRAMTTTALLVGLGSIVSLGVRAETDDYSSFLKLMETGNCVECELENGNFRGAHLSYVDLRASNLQGAQFYREGPESASLEGANLETANFHSADLRQVNFRGSNLSDADLRQANLSGSDLRGADLQGADLRGANLEGAQIFASTPETDSSVSESSNNVLSTDGTVVAAGEQFSFVLEADRDFSPLAAQLEGALFDQQTSFPDGFDPVRAGMIYTP